MPGRCTSMRCSRKSWTSSPCATASSPYTRPWRKLYIWISKLSLHSSCNTVHLTVMRSANFVHVRVNQIRKYLKLMCLQTIFTGLCMCVLMWWAVGGAFMIYKQHANSFISSNEKRWPVTSEISRLFDWITACRWRLNGHTNTHTYCTHTFTNTVLITLIML